ncbi:hypothetical protein SNARM312S_03356 [Streptomyces narbonensis]
MRVSDVLAADAREPDHLLHAEGLDQLVLDLIPALPAVAVVVDDRALRDEEGALAVGLEGAALGDERCLLAGNAVPGEQLAANLAVVGVLLLVSPAVEVEVDPEQLAVVLDEDGHGVAGPQVVHGEGDDLHLPAAGLLRRRHLLRAGHHHDLLVLPDRPRDPGDVLPHVGQVVLPDGGEGGPGHERTGVAVPLGAEVALPAGGGGSGGGAGRAAERGVLRSAGGGAEAEGGADAGEGAQGGATGGEEVGHSVLRSWAGESIRRWPWGRGGRGAVTESRALASRIRRP